MKKAGWRKKIRAACEEAGTYEPQYDIVIDTLAEIMENRDAAVKLYKDSGGEPVVMHTNQGGNANMVKNPCLVMINDLNASALAYWRDLGLTPSGYKKLDGKAVKAAKRETTFEDVLKGIGI